MFQLNLLHVYINVSKQIIHYMTKTNLHNNHIFPYIASCYRKRSEIYQVAIWPWHISKKNTSGIMVIWHKIKKKLRVSRKGLFKEAVPLLLIWLSTCMHSNIQLETGIVTLIKSSGYIHKNNYSKVKTKKKIL